MTMLIKRETLDRMFDNDVGKRHFKQSGKCYNCGSEVEIIIVRTSKGYGFQGGVLYESNTDQIFMLCNRCIRNTERLNHLAV